MGSTTSLIIFIAIVEFSLYALGLVTTPTTALFQLFTNFNGWSSLSMVSMLGGVIFGLGAVISIAGYFYKSDTMIFSGMAGVLLSYASTFISLYSIFKANSNEFIAIITIAPLVLAYIFLVVGWLRGRET